MSKEKITVFFPTQTEAASSDAYCLYLQTVFRETCNWFAHSAKWKSDCKNIYETINDGGRALKFLWLVIDCLDGNLDQEEELKLHFSLVSNADLLFSQATE